MLKPRRVFTAPDGREIEEPYPRDADSGLMVVPIEAFFHPDHVTKYIDLSLDELGGPLRHLPTVEDFMEGTERETTWIDLSEANELGVMRI